MKISKALMKKNTIDLIDYENNTRYASRYFKRMFGLTKNETIESFIEEFAFEEYKDEKRVCAFCGKLKKIKSMQVYIDGNFIKLDLEYAKDIHTCSGRTDIKVCASKTLNSNSIEYISKSRNVSEEEARRIIHERNPTPFYKENHESQSDYSIYQRRDKKWFEDNNKDFESIIKEANYKRSLEGHINRYGEEEGTEKYLSLNKLKDTQSLIYFTTKYGEEEGVIKYNEYCFNQKVGSKRCIEHYEALGHSKEASKILVSKYQDKVSMPKFIERYGEEIGPERYEEHSEYKSYIRTLPAYIEKYGEEEGNKKYLIDNQKCAITLEKMILKYGEEEGNKKYTSWRLNVGFVKKSRTSKESLKNLFITLYKKLRRELKISKDDIFFGMGKSKEWFIYDNENRKVRMYDFTIKSLKIIIEYHGSNWHYNPCKDYRKIKLPFSKKVKDYKEKDEEKRILALKNGFIYIEVFDTDDFDKKIAEIINIVERSLWNKLF